MYIIITNDWAAWLHWNTYFAKCMIIIYRLSVNGNTQDKQKRRSWSGAGRREQKTAAADRRAHLRSDFSKFGHFLKIDKNWPHVGPKTPKFERLTKAFWHLGCMNLELQILRMLLEMLNFERKHHTNHIWDWDIFEQHICVEPGKLPFGPTSRDSRGECCAPFTSKTHAEHTLEVIFQSLGIFWNLSKIDHMWDQKPQSLKGLQKHFGIWAAWISSFKY